MGKKAAAYNGTRTVFRIVTEMVLGQFTHMPTLAYHYGSNLQPLVFVVKKTLLTH